MVTSLHTLSDEQAEFPDFAYVLLVNTKRRAVLMCLNEGKWDLPYFVYPNSLREGRLIETLCEDVKDWIKIKNEDVFCTLPAEFVGYFLGGHEQIVYDILHMQIYLLELHGNVTVEQLELPDNAEWKTAQFAASLISDPAIRFQTIKAEIVRDCLEDSYLLSLTDPRYRPGWFDKASKLLTDLVLSRSEHIFDRVVQYQMNMKSTILKLKTSTGSYFLKSPAIGCNEATITATIARLFPDVSPIVLGISDELHCFITEEFKCNKRVNSDVMRNAVLALGRLQIESLSYLEALRTAGCPNRDLILLPGEMSKWLSTESRVSEWYALRELKKFAPILTGMCEKLGEFHIPQALVHGDFSLGNVAYDFRDGKNVLLLFDWEFGHMGHPFTDFHRIFKDVSDDLLDEYLELWSSFEDLGRAREAYDIARRLGCVTKAWSLWEWTEQCNAQKKPCMAKWYMDLIHEVGFYIPQEQFSGA